MPIVITQVKPTITAEAAEKPQDVNALLWKEDGKPTLVGLAIESFLGAVDYNDLMSDPEVAEHLETSKTVALFFESLGLALELSDEDRKLIKEAKEDDKKEDDKEDDKEDKEDDKEDGDDEGKDNGKDDKADESKEDDKKADKDAEDDAKDDEGEGEDDDEEDEKADECAEAEVEVLSGEAAAELIDEEDLAFMYIDYIRDLPESTLAEKTIKAAAIKEMDMTEAELTEWARGGFAKERKKNLNKVQRMLGAMLVKQAIARGKPGQTRYVAPGAKAPSATYTKAGQAGAAGGGNVTGKVQYGHGTPMGVKKYYKFVGGHAAKSAAGEMKSRTKVKKSAAEIAKSAQAKASGAKTFKAAAKTGEPMKNAKANLLKRKVPTPKGEKGAGKQGLLAHDDTAVSKVTESHPGAKLTRKIISICESRHKPQ